MTCNLVGRILAGAAPVLLVLSMATPTIAAPDACSTGIDQVQAELDAALASRAAAGPVAKESVFATQRRQPTPESVARAEAQLGDWQGGTKAVAALSDARNAKARGDQRACLEALQSARRIIGQ